jgi:hypothetical protein
MFGAARNFSVRPHVSLRQQAKEVPMNKEQIKGGTKEAAGKAQ